MSTRWVEVAVEVVKIYCVEVDENEQAPFEVACDKATDFALESAGENEIVGTDWNSCRFVHEDYVKGMKEEGYEVIPCD